MAACTFFGHHECPSSIKPKLEALLVDLIENHAVDTFYVGNKGAFDRIVRSVLQDLAEAYPSVKYAVVLERIPNAHTADSGADYSDTLLPDGIETVPPRFTIVWRNQWMLRRSDYVITYITHSWGGAAKFAESAKRQNKTVINLATDH